MGRRSFHIFSCYSTNPSFAINDSGQLSIDFFIGLSIFLITLIIAATMVSGLLVGLQSKKIDYDAVAYRTGVLLVEDPGEPNTQFGYQTIREEHEWEFVGIDQKSQVKRFGLTLYKSTPHTLSEQKVISFYNRTRYPSLSEYRERIIFGDIPYRFNISLKLLGDDHIYTPIGEVYNTDSTYGYIRRVVLVKNQTHAEVDMSRPGYYNNTTPGDGRFVVSLDYDKLMDLDRAPQYWVEPPKEEIVINLTNIQSIRNQSMNPSDNVILEAIKIEYYGKIIQGSYQWGELPLEVTAEIDGNSVTYEWPGDAGDDTDVDSAINITFPAGFFIPPSSYANIDLIRMNVTYVFDPGTVNISQENSTYPYLYGSPGFSPPHLNPGVLEVRVW